MTLIVQCRTQRICPLRNKIQSLLEIRFFFLFKNTKTIVVYVSLETIRVQKKITELVDPYLDNERFQTFSYLL